MPPIVKEGFTASGLAQARASGVEHPLLMTILSAIAGWSLLATLAVGLFLILRPLENVRGYMQKITMGVRAIEQQTKPFDGHARELTTSLRESSGALAAVGRGLADVEHNLDAAVPALRRRS